MICNNCGQEVAGGLARCPKCGGEMPYGEPIHPTADSATPGSIPEPHDSRESFPTSTGPVTAQSQSTPTVSKIRKGFSTLIFIIFVGSMAYSAASDWIYGTPEEQAGQMLNDALYSTEESSDPYVVIMKQVLDYYKKESEVLVALDKKLLESDFMSPESFATKASILGYIKDLDLYITEAERLRVNQATYQQNALNIILNSSLSETDKESATKSWNEAVGNQNLKGLTNKRFIDMINWAKSARAMYVFLESSFGNYEIQQDETGESLVGFYEDADREEYIRLANDMDEKYSLFQVSDQAYRNAANQYLGSMIEGVNVEDFENYYYR